MKVMTVLGTRPEIIRLSRVMALLDQHTDHVLVHTGQNWDYELNQVFFDDLGVRKPDHFLDVDTSSLGTVYGDVMIKSEQVLRSESPDAVLILGDTNSALAAIMAKRLHIPIFHMEAGNRSFDWRVPEEVNRHIVDSISDVNLVYTEHARRNLLNEGLPPNRIYKTGSPLAEVLGHYREQIDASDILDRQEVSAGEYFLVSLHREDNVDNPEVLGTLLHGLAALADEHGIPALVSLHPRTAKRIDEFGLTFSDTVRMNKPFGFFDWNKLQANARCVISDSGTISEEAAILGFAGVTPRRAMERPEAMDAGSVILAGIEPDDIIAAVAYSLTRPLDALQIPEAYEVADCANRVLSLILSRPLVTNV